MHYYKFNIPDWVLHTSHLEPDEEAIYFRLLNHYYDTELPIPKETQTVLRRLRLLPYSEKVQIILQEYFTLDGNFWYHKRCDFEIEAYHAKAERNRAVGQKGGRPKKTQTKPTANPNLTQNNLKQETTNINHNTIIKAQRGSRLPHDWVLTKSLGEWAQSERPDLNIRQVAEQFKDYWIAQAGQKGVKLDWSATWRNGCATANR